LKCGTLTREIVYADRLVKRIILAPVKEEALVITFDRNSTRFVQTVCCVPNGFRRWFENVNCPVLLLCLVLTFLHATCTANADDSPYATWGHDPYSARIVTGDLEHFWFAYDHSSRGNRLDAMRGYVANGSPGEHDFIPNRIISGDHLASVVDSHDAFYQTVRPWTLRARNYVPQIRQIFSATQKLLGKDAVFPDVYFVIGALSSGGTAGKHGLIVGTEVVALPINHEEKACRDLAWLCSAAQPIDRVPFIVAHELVHAQQWSINRERVEEADHLTLLQMALAEGVADFLAERLSGLHRVAPYVTFGAAHREEVRTAFYDAPFVNKTERHRRLLFQRSGCTSGMAARPRV